ncbi:MAG: hypothetical protein M1814_004401 [Vezdaea aestivalis]|nr:MAG: hypothetical protein M1814_004401 [Vezdaea aestivalis]
MASPNSASNQSRSSQNVNELILELYRASDPRRIDQIQATLQEIQRSNEAWRLADTLLDNEDEKVRFFGALTLTVKLNLDWQTLDEARSMEILNGLITWFIKLLARSTTALVLKKMCGTLVAFFLHFSSSWERCINHLLRSMVAGTLAPINIAESASSPNQTLLLLNNLNTLQNSALLWFTTILVDEVQKIDLNSATNQALLARVKVNLEDAATIIHCNIQKSLSYQDERSLDAYSLGPEAIKSFQSWVTFSHKIFLTSESSFDCLRDLVPVVIRCLDFVPLFESACECLSDILGNFTILLRKEHIQTLFAWSSQSTAAKERYEGLLEGDFDFELLAFGGLLLALAEASIEDLVQSIEEPNTIAFMQKLHGLLHCPGYPVAEDEICTLTLEFWAAFVEHMIDSLFDGRSTGASWAEPVRIHIVQVIEECWTKIHIPPAEILTSWDAHMIRGFKTFRKDTADILQSSYTFLGSEIFDKLISLALKSLSEEAWLDTEATLYYLNVLNDTIAFDQVEELALCTLFDSTLFILLSSPTSNVPGKLCHSAVTLIGNYSTFFEQHLEYLPAALNFLFKSLDSPAQASVASKSIHLLSKSCRSALTAELGVFLSQYQAIANSSATDSSTKQAILGGMAAIIQALPTDRDRIAPLEQLLAFVEQDSNILGVAIKERDIEKARNAGLGVLQALVEIGKGLQEPEDTPLDLESETPASTFWNEGQGAQFQERVVRATEYIFDLLSGDGDVVESACQFVRIGLTERHPGPFVFPPEIIANFVLKSDINTPRVGQMLRTACSLITAHNSPPSKRIEREAKLILQHLMNLTRKIGGPDDDPEIAQWVVEYFTRLMPNYIGVIFEHSTPVEIEEIFTFALKCLSGPDQMPKKSASTFWVSFLGLTDLSENHQSLFQQTMTAIGPGLSGVLIEGIGGGCARSMIDVLSGPLKRLVARHPQSRKWLEDALKTGLRAVKAGEAQKRVFLAKVIGLRGGRETGDVAREFWLTCRGLKFAYA